MTKHSYGNIKTKIKLEHKLHCQINQDPDPDVCQISPKMLWIHYTVGVRRWLYEKCLQIS